MATKGTKRVKGTNDMAENLAYAAKYGPDYLTGYAIGTALGNLWGDNYNRRGLEKSNATTAAGTDKIFNSEYQQYLPQSESAPEQLFNQGVQGGAFSLNGDNSKNMMQLGEETKALERSGDLQPLSFQKERNLEEEKLDYLAKKYGGQTPNPDGDAMVIGNLSNKIKGDLQNVDASKIPRVLTENDYIAPIRKQLQKEGRTEYQIEQAIENARPDIQSKVKQGQDIVFGRLGNLLNTQLQSGDLDNARATYARMAEINPTMAKAMGTGLNRAAANDEAQYQLDNKAAFYRKNDPTLTEQQSKNMAMYGNIYSPLEQAEMRNSNSRIYSGGNGSGGNSGSGNGGGITKADIAGLDSYGKFLENMINNLSEDDPRLPSLRAEYNLIQAGQRQAWRKKLGLPDEDTTQGVPAQTAQPAQSTQDSAQQPAEQSQAPLSDAAEQQRQRDYNKNQAIQAANRANLWINPYNSSDIRPAGPYDRATEQQSNTFKDWYARYGYLFNP